MLRKLLLNFITYSLGKCYRMSFQWVKESFRSSLNTFYIYVHNFFIIIVFQNLVVWQPWQQKNVSKVGFLNFLLFSTSYYIFEEMKALKIMQEKNWRDTWDHDNYKVLEYFSRNIFSEHKDNNQIKKKIFKWYRVFIWGMKICVKLYSEPRNVLTVLSKIEHCGCRQQKCLQVLWHQFIILAL